MCLFWDEMGTLFSGLQKCPEAPALNLWKDLCSATNAYPGDLILEYC